jgi:hypothetical protein
MLIERMIRAARLEPQLYDEVEHDQNATGQAFAVVLIVALCALIGSALSGHRTQGLIGAGFGAIVGWLIWSLIILVVGRILGGRADFGEVMRALAFADTPGVFHLFSSFPIFGPLIGLVAGVWTVIATVIAVREAMDFDTGRAVLTVLIPVGIMILLGILAVMVAAALGIALFTLIR